MSNNARRRIGQLEAQRGSKLPHKIIRWGSPPDGLYHEGDRTYTPEEFEALEATGDYQIILVTYGDWRQNK